MMILEKLILILPQATVLGKKKHYINVKFFRQFAFGD